MIRFACPNCKRFLSGQDEQAGDIVTCPKCGQRMQTSRLSPALREKRTRSSHRPRITGSVLVGVLLLCAAGGGIGVWNHFLDEQLDPIENASRTPSSKATGETPAPPQKTSETPASPQKTGETPVPPQKTGETPVPPQKKKSPPAEDKKEIELADDLPPELSFDLVDAINVQRTKAGLGPIFLDGELSRACQSRAEELARHAAPFSSTESSVSAHAPLPAIEKWLKESKPRTAILESRLRTFGAGFARNADGQWVSVFDWTHGLDRETPMETKPVTGAIVYPAPGQNRVSLWFPGNETPDPLPQTKDKLAGYPITLIFPQGTRIQEAAAHLSCSRRLKPAATDNKESGIPLWLSAPDKPANPRFAGSQQNTICLIAKTPLRPNTRYHVEVSATVNGAAWSAKWDFTTVSAGEIHQRIAGSFLRMFNRLRRRAGLLPVPLNAERSKACAVHAQYLGRNVPSNPSLNWNDEKTDLPGYSAEGAAVARRASIQGGGGPIEAVTGLIDSLISRPQLLDPRLSELDLGYAPFIQGGWIWVIDLHLAAGKEASKEYFYPAPDQDNVPLVYPPNEVPSPIPASEKRATERGNEKRTAGYAITVLFGPRVRLTAAGAKLVDEKGNDVDGWLSTPDKPAIAGFAQHSLCFLPKAPLRPGTRYTATFRAEIDGRPWRRTWSFTTLKEPDRYSDDLDTQIVAQVNAVRKAAGLPPVRLDAELSRGCQAHARYLALNHRCSATLGMDVHGQDASLPGASPEGARAAKESVIAVVLDPQTCIENWMATLYHRIPILAPNLERVGFAHARIRGHKWVCVLDTGNGRKPHDR